MAHRWRGYCFGIVHLHEFRLGLVWSITPTFTNEFQYNLTQKTVCLKCCLQKGLLDEGFQQNNSFQFCFDCEFLQHAGNYSTASFYLYLSTANGSSIWENYSSSTFHNYVLVVNRCSMGGAIAVHTAIRDLVPSLSGLVVIDVVEGTALEALSSMQSFLRGRPKVFKSIEHAIEWWYVS